MNPEYASCAHLFCAKCGCRIDGMMCGYTCEYDAELPVDRPKGTVIIIRFKYDSHDPFDPDVVDRSIYDY